MFKNSIYPLARPLSIATCKKLLYGEKGIVEGPLYLVELLESVLSPDELEEYWGLQLLDLPNFAQYVLYLRETYGLDLFKYFFFFFSFFKKKKIYLGFFFFFFFFH